MFPNLQGSCGSIHNNMVKSLASVATNLPLNPSFSKLFSSFWLCGHEQVPSDVCTYFLIYKIGLMIRYHGAIEKMVVLLLFLSFSAFVCLMFWLSSCLLGPHSFKAHDDQGVKPIPGDSGPGPYRSLDQSARDFCTLKVASGLQSLSTRKSLRRRELRPFTLSCRVSQGEWDRLGPDPLVLIPGQSSPQATKYRETLR